MAGLFASCRVTKKYAAPKAVVPENYRETVVADTLTMATMPWKEVFTDTVLQRLIGQGLVANADLKIAVERINQSKASLRMSKNAFLPSLNGTVSVKESRLAYPQGFGLFKQATQYDLGLNTGWEIDIWGKLSSGKRAAVADLLASDAAKRAIQTQLIADIAHYYYELLSLDAQLDVTQKTAANRAADAKAIALLFENSILNGVAVVQSEANYYEAELDIPDLLQKIRETENALAVLLGQTPEAIGRTTIAEQQLVYDLKPGIPAQLLANRPDVQEAEYNFRASFENTNVARASFYPALTITGAGGFSSFGLSNWFTNTGLFGNIAGGLTQSIFNRGSNKAQLNIAVSRQKQALYAFELSLLKASKEVSDALSSYQNAEAKSTTRKKQLEALTKAVTFNKELLNNNRNTNYTDVLTAEQNLLKAQLKGITDQVQQLHAVVSLYRALGGGWN